MVKKMRKYIQVTASDNFFNHLSLQLTKVYSINIRFKIYIP